MERLRRRAVANPRRVLLPETDDPRVVEAARIGVRESLFLPVFPAAVDGAEGAVVLAAEPDHEACQARIDAAIAERLARKGKDAADNACRQPLMRAAALLRLGYAEAVVAGSLASTSEVLRCGLALLDKAPGCELISSFFLIEWQGRVFTFGDCAVVPNPDAQRLAEIAITCAASHERLTGETPRVALLSFSTHGSAEHAEVDKVREAVTIARSRAPHLAIDGELQFDTAVEAAIAARKAPDSAVAGRANVLIFPNLDAGNIGYKIAERMGGARAYGPIVQGLVHPWMDLSRGCSADDIVNVAVIASALVSDEKNPA